MGLISWVSSLDMAPAYYQPLTNKRKGYTLCCCGCLSLVLWLLIILYVLMYLESILTGRDKSYDVTQYPNAEWLITDTSNLDLQFRVLEEGNRTER